MKLNNDRENPYFMIGLPNSCPLKYPSWFEINLKFLLEIKIHLFIFLRTKTVIMSTIDKINFDPSLTEVPVSIFYTVKITFSEPICFAKPFDLDR